MAAATALVTGGMALYQGIDGYNTKKQGQRAMNSYDRTDLTNAYADTQISTMGTQYLNEQSHLANSNLINAARNGGIRGIMGGMPQIAALNNNQNQEGRMYLDQQNIRRTDNIAQDDIRLRQLGVAIDESNLAAISSQINTGRQDMWSGMMGIAKAGRWGLQNGAFSEDAWKLGGSAPKNDQASLNIYAANDRGELV